MEVIHPTWQSLLWLPGALALFLLPGWLLARRIAAPLYPVAAFCASAVILVTLALAMDAVHVPLHATTIGAGLALVAVAIWRWPGTGPQRAPAAPGLRPSAIWLVPIAIALTSITARVLIEPLSGYDNFFRWDYLARLICSRQSLAGYPAVSAADFEYYSWCDGIPPLVPLLNFWIYTVCGSFAPALITARVVGEMLILGSIVWHYSRLLWGERAGPAAVAALATSALAAWSLAISQETGLTAIALVAMLYYLELHARAPQRRLVVCAALAAAVGALTREYGLVFPLLGLGVLAARGTLRAGWLLAGISLALAAPWYLRNWVITGNPVYPQTVGGLFPGNAVHEEIMRSVAGSWSLRTSAFVPLCAIVGVLAGAVMLVGAIGATRRPRGLAAMGAGIVLTVALWLWSIPYTAGGWVYSTRVLLPALALLAVLAGWLACARGWRQIAVAAILSLAALEAGRRSWMLPAFPFTSVTDVSFANWRRMYQAAHDPAPVAFWRQLAHTAAGRGIIVDHPAHHVMLTLNEGNAVPLVSPAVAAAFDDRLPFPAAVQRLRQANIRFATMTPRSPVTADLVYAHPFWTELCLHHAPNAYRGLIAVYDLDNLQPLPAP